MKDKGWTPLEASNGTWWVNPLMTMVKPPPNIFGKSTAGYLAVCPSRDEGSKDLVRDYRWFIFYGGFLDGILSPMPVELNQRLWDLRQELRRKVTADIGNTSFRKNIDKVPGYAPKALMVDDPEYIP